MPDLKQIPVQAKLRVERARANHGAVDVVVRTFKRFSEDDGGFYAAALTYYVFFSVFPMLIFATAMLGIVTRIWPAVEADLIEEGFETIPLLNSIVTPDVLADIQRAAGTLALMSVVLALYSGTGGVVALGHALNKIHRVEEEGNFLVKRLNSIKWLGIFGALVLASLVLGSVVAVVPGVGALLGLGVGFALNVLIFVTAFKFLPRLRRAWRDVLPGALAAGIVFEALKYFGALYIKNGAEGREATFGAFATAAGLLVASYLLAQITLLAAELNAVLAERRLTRQSLLT